MEIEEIEKENPYLEYLGQHPKLKKKSVWIDSQFDNKKNISEYLAFFYVFEYEKEHIGIVESLRPNSATYLYSFPNEYTRLYEYVYKNHFGNPYIKREYSEEEKKELEEVKRLVKEKEKEKKISSSSKSFEDNYRNYYMDPDIEDLKERIEDINLNIHKPIKQRHYFVDEIPHADTDTWIIGLENTIIKYLKGQLNQKKKDIIYIHDCFIDSAIASLCYDATCLQVKEADMDNVSYIIKQMNSIRNEMENNKKRQKKGKVNKLEEQVKKIELSDFVDKNIVEIGVMCEMAAPVLLKLLQKRTCLKLDSIYTKLGKEQIGSASKVLDELLRVRNKNMH